jgi:hypothetical protein
MKIKLISLGCKIPNLALMKISAWHKKQGDQVSFDEPEPDKIYVSSPFSAYKNYTYKHFYPDADIEYGGYGFNNNQLPHEIEHIMPDYDIFKCGYSMGYTTRGCIRNCVKPPCIVPQCEGKLKRNSHIKEFHNKHHKKVVLLDNNIFADKEWFFKNMEYVIENDLILSSQGFDIKLLDAEIAECLSKIRFEKQIYFALDTMFDIENEIMLLSRHGIKPYRLMFYIYEKDDFDDLYHRFEYIAGFGADPFVMPDLNATTKIKHFARFVNKRIYKVSSWKNYKYFIR